MATCCESFRAAISFTPIVQTSGWQTKPHLAAIAHAPRARPWPCGCLSLTSESPHTGSAGESACVRRRRLTLPILPLCLVCCTQCSFHWTASSQRAPHPVSQQMSHGDRLGVTSSLPTQHNCVGGLVTFTSDDDFVWFFVIIT